MPPLPKDEDASRQEGMQTQSRKKDHVDIILKDDVRARVNAWDDVALLHEAMPEVDFDAIALGTTFLGKRLEAPLMIASMTGGYADAERINGNLAAAAAEHGLGMGVGSQRAAVLKPETRRSFTVVRDHDVPFVAANIGAPQLIGQARKALTREEVSEVVSMVEADALIVHLNYLQEVVQPEGDRRAEGVEAAIRDLTRDLGIPVVAKETGAGMRRATAVRLKRAGVAAFDVGGLSGTTFAAVELVRATKEKAATEMRLGALFRDWGIPTPVSVLEARVGLPIVATGGLRSGLDVARALALGAELGGMASAALTPANVGAKEAGEFLRAVLHELRTACFLTGSRRAADLRRVPVVFSDALATWTDALGHKREEYGHARNRVGD